MAIHLGPDGILHGKITVVRKKAFPDFKHETVERKGKGHPDTIADSLASLISRKYSQYTLANCDGLILHHQIDKLMVIGGKTELSWGNGKFDKPIKIIVAGRASKTYIGKEIPVEKIVKQTITDFFYENFPIIDVDHDLVIQNELTDYAGPGTITSSKGSIAHMFDPQKPSEVRGYENLVANDTSFCISYWPLSTLENAIIDMEGYLNLKKTKDAYPWLGSDFKIMAVRNSDKINITMCVPQIAKYVYSLEEYKHNLKIISNKIMMILSKYFSDDNVELSVNTKDDYEKNNVYLTVSGSSLSGDIGVVGRGNRVNGLITSARPMSLEGSSGKNPRYYSGFIYAELTKRLAKKIFNKTKKECVVEVVSQNGGPLLDPWQTTVTGDFSNEEEIRNIVLDEFRKIPEITKDFLKGKVITC